MWERSLSCHDTMYWSWVHSNKLLRFNVNSNLQKDVFSGSDTSKTSPEQRSKATPGGWGCPHIPLTLRFWSLTVRNQDSWKTMSPITWGRRKIKVVLDILWLPENKMLSRVSEEGLK